MVRNAGKSKELLRNNGPEFTCRKHDERAYRNKVKMQSTEPGKPAQKGFAECFIGTLRNECLNENRRNTFTKIRSHSSLNYLTPEEFKKYAKILSRLTGINKKIKLTYL